MMATRVYTVIKMHLKGIYCIVWNLHIFKKVFEKKGMIAVLIRAVGNIGLGQETVWKGRP